MSLTFLMQSLCDLTRCVRCVQVRSKDPQVKTKPVLWIFISFKGTTCFGLYHQAIIMSQVNIDTAVQNGARGSAVG